MLDSAGKSLTSRESSASFDQQQQQQQRSSGPAKIAACSGGMRMMADRGGLPKPVVAQGCTEARR
jgi:hypothetical protein